MNTPTSIFLALMALPASGCADPWDGECLPQDYSLNYGTWIATVDEPEGALAAELTVDEDHIVLEYQDALGHPVVVRYKRIAKLGWWSDGLWMGNVPISPP